jgi:hypothetical protein
LLNSMAQLLMSLWTGNAVSTLTSRAKWQHTHTHTCPLPVLPLARVPHPFLHPTRTPTTGPPQCGCWSQTPAPGSAARAHAQLPRSIATKRHTSTGQPVGYQSTHHSKHHLNTHKQECIQTTHTSKSAYRHMQGFQLADAGAFNHVPRANSATAQPLLQRHTVTLCVAGIHITHAPTPAGALR